MVRDKVNTWFCLKRLRHRRGEKSFLESALLLLCSGDWTQVLRPLYPLNNPPALVLLYGKTAKTLPWEHVKHSEDFLLKNFIIVKTF